jgi:hypothetical protein
LYRLFWLFRYIAKQTYLNDFVLAICGFLAVFSQGWFRHF